MKILLKGYGFFYLRSKIQIAKNDNRFFLKRKMNVFGIPQLKELISETEKVWLN